MGEELFEKLDKALTKLSTSSVVDIGELYHSLKVTPKAVVAFLVRKLRNMKDAKEIKLPWAKNATMLINKLDNDVYQGHIAEDGQIRHEFKLTSLPALAAHLTSYFELYDEDNNPKSEPKEASSKKEHSGDSGKFKELENRVNALHLKMLESKIDSLMALVANRHVEKDEKQVNNLNKAGTMPTMPKPPKPGTKVGGMQGISRTGIMGAKTPATDRLSLPTIALNKPQIATKVKRTLTFKKSDTNHTCMECKKNEFDGEGSYTGCDCWRGFSKPKIKKSENSITLEFNQDWDDDAVLALLRSIKGQPNE